MTVVAVAAALGAMGAVGWSAKPSGWADIGSRLEQLAPEQRAAMAEALQNRLVSAWSAPPGVQTAEQYYQQVVTPDPQDASPATHTVRVEIDELNAWLDTRLRKLVEHQGQPYPAWLESVRVWTEGERLVLGVRVRRSGMDQVFSFLLGFDTPEGDEHAVMRIEGARAGLLPVPLGQLMERLGPPGSGSARRDTARALVEELRQGVVVSEWVSKLDDDRPVRVSRVAVSDGVVEIVRSRAAAADLAD
ncbi:MAG: hypothetical protein AAF288_00140 [Planctomycetota bacterium]